MIGSNHQHFTRYAPGIKAVKRLYLGETLTQRISSPVSEVSLEECILEDSLRNDFSCFRELAAKLNIRNTGKTGDGINFSRDSPRASARPEYEQPMAIQAFSRYHEACESFDDVVQSSQMSASTRFRALLDIQRKLINANFLLEAVISRSEKAGRAGKKSHSQSTEIKGKALKLLSDLLPPDGWRSMHQAAHAIHEELHPLVKAQRGRLSPLNFEARLLRWLNDTREPLIN